MSTKVKLFTIIFVLTLALLTITTMSAAQPQYSCVPEATLSAGDSLSYTVQNTSDAVCTVKVDTIQFDRNKCQFGICVKGIGYDTVTVTGCEGCKSITIYTALRATPAPPPVDWYPRMIFIPIVY